VANARFRGLSCSACRLGLVAVFAAGSVFWFPGTSSDVRAAAARTCTPKYDCEGDPFSLPPAPPPPKTGGGTGRTQDNVRQVCGAGSVAAQGRKVALVIGELNYKNNGLKSSGSDADKVAAALKAGGFAVTVKCNLNRDEISNELRDFGRAAGNADDAVIYFTGHAFAGQNNVNYIVPVGTNIQALSDVTLDGIPVENLADMAGQAKNLKLIVIDGCRDNLLLPNGGGSSARCFAPVDYKDRIVAFSAGPGSLAKDGGPYAAAFAKYAGQEFAGLKEMFDAIAMEVQQGTSGSQAPQVYPASFTAPALRAKMCDPKEDGAWDFVRNSSDPSLLQNFLSTYPNGCHAPEAKAKIPTDPAEVAWNALSKTDAEALKKFIQDNPSSSHVPEARGRIEDISYNAVRNGTDLGAIEAFLRDYPTSTHGAELRNRILVLKEPGEWAELQKAENSGNLDKWEGYVRTYPNGPHLAEAKVKIEGIKRDQTLAFCPANIGPAAALGLPATATPTGAAPVQGTLNSPAMPLLASDLIWTQNCLGRLNASVAQAVQQSREAEAQARQKAAAGRDAQMRARAAAEQARDAEKSATAPSPAEGYVVQDFTKQRLGTYKGQITNGQRNGAGVWIDINGERYEGEWKGDGRNGTGKTVPGRMGDPIFEGTWENGNPCGVGVLTWPSGDRYEGDYCMGHYTGYGIFYFATNSNTNYARENIGQWNNDKQTGYGVRLWAGLNRSEGQWVDGQLAGYGAEFSGDGKIQTKLDVPQQGIYEGGNLKTPLARNP